MVRREPTRVVILGGGFGGVYTALELCRRARRDRPIEITLVNRDNFLLFTPMLHEVAASDLDFSHIVSPLRKLLPGVRLFHGEIRDIDLGARTVIVSHGRQGHRHGIPYDQLVLALGSETNYFDLPGVERHALTMKSLQDAFGLRNRVLANLEEADFECCAAARESLLRIVVAGGGFAGVETVGALHDFVREAVRFYPNLCEADVRLVLVEAGERLLPELGPELGDYAASKLRSRGIEVRTGVLVRGATANLVELSDGTRLAARTLVWTAGVSPHPLLASLPVAKDRGRVRVTPELSVAEWPGIWALGDCASVPNDKTEAPSPPTAQHAIRQAQVVATNIVAALRGGKRRRFSYRSVGQLAAIGQRTGVARVFGLQFSGFFAWWLWRTVYLTKLPRAEKKIRVLLDWTLDLLFSKDLVQFETGRSVPNGSRSGAATMAPKDFESIRQEGALR